MAKLANNMRVEQVKSGKYLKDHEGKLYPQMENRVITRISNPHVAKDNRRGNGRVYTK